MLGKVNNKLYLRPAIAQIIKFFLKIVINFEALDARLASTSPFDKAGYLANLVQFVGHKEPR